MMTEERIPYSRFLKTRVARRFFYLFVLCALVPLLAIAGISYVYVGGQLKDQAFKRLHQQVKSKGLEVYDRLLFVETELEAVARKIRQDRWDETELIPFQPLRHEGSRFRDIETIPVDQETLFPLRLPDMLSNFTKETLDHLKNGGSFLGIAKDLDHVSKVLMIRFVEPSEPAQGIIMGEVDPLYLWGIGMEGALLPEVELAVFTLEKHLLISSFQSPKFIRTIAEKKPQGSFSGDFETTYEGKIYLNSYWPLFLRHHFASSDWIFVFSQSRASVLEPVFKFSRFFGLLLLLTLWIIILITLVTLRKRMVPVEKLKAATMKIAQGDFGYQVDIKSGDEFELLAETFNEMSLKLKQGQDMLVQAAKVSAFGQMAAGIVHEVGQPLTAINGYAELLKLGVAPEEEKRYLDIISSEGTRLSQIVSKFRSFLRSSKEELAPISLKEVLIQTTSLLEHQLKRGNVELKMETAEPPSVIYGDKNELKQVFLNLMINAIDALEKQQTDERRILVKINGGPDSVQVHIEDNGCGIPPEIQPRIFDPFFTTKEEEGTGLGLAIISSILHKHHARIECRSEVNQGTRFTIHFPRPEPKTYEG